MKKIELRNYYRNTDGEAIKRDHNKLVENLELFLENNVDLKDGYIPLEVREAKFRKYLDEKGLLTLGRTQKELNLFKFKKQFSEKSFDEMKDILFERAVEVSKKTVKAFPKIVYGTQSAYLANVTSSFDDYLDSMIDSIDSLNNVNTVDEIPEILFLLLDDSIEEFKENGLYFYLANNLGEIRKSYEYNLGNFDDMYVLTDILSRKFLRY